MATMKAEFDGRVFVPYEPVELPAGTKVEVIIPPRKPTEEENRQWQEFLKKLRASEPYFPTLEDALRYTRKYPPEWRLDDYPSHE